MMDMSWEATKQVYGWVVENYDGAYKEKVTFYRIFTIKDVCCFNDLAFSTRAGSFVTLSDKESTD